MIRSAAAAVAASMTLAAVSAATAQERRLLRPDDIYSIKTVGDPQVSPDGTWVAYTVASLDRDEDRSDADIYMSPAAGGNAVRLTSSNKPERRPRWSPDGRYLGFLSSRDTDEAQIWLLDRRGGEAQRLTDFKGGVSEFAWAPDGKRLAIIATDPDPKKKTDSGKESEDKKPKPIVIRRLQFKQDGAGYLTDERDHLYVFDLATKTSVQVTRGPYDDKAPAWSPDGKRIAFVSNRSAEPDANDNTDIFVIDAGGSVAEPTALTTTPGEDGSPRFSPDGRSIVFIQGGDPKDIWYATNNLAVISAAGGAPRVLTPTLDRNVRSPRISGDGRDVLFLLEDGGNVNVAKVPIAGGAVDRIVAGEREIESFDLGPTGAVAVLETTPMYPGEVSVVAGNGLTRISHVNDAFLSGIRLGQVERMKVKSSGGASIDAFLTRPPDAAAGTKSPAILRIHGGPVSQYSTGFELEWQMLAAAGYVVVAANPRGSSGYGRDFSRAIFADWGNKDFDDVMAAVDGAIARGAADGERLGVGGWSYGGILTNYVITKTGRFKAAISGASEVNYLSNYGTDHYQKEWEAELGLPWRAADSWIKLSPFFNVERVVTPTLILCGQDDMNVPLLNSEQLYQALRRLGKTTELVIYPGQHHGISRPSFVKDRYERYIAWYDRFLKPGETTSPAR